MVKKSTEEPAYSISYGKNGKMTIRCSVTDIIPLRQELNRIVKEEIIKVAKSQLDNHGVTNFAQIARQFHCHYMNISVMLRSNGFSSERSVKYCKLE